MINLFGINFTDEAAVEDYLCDCIFNSYKDGYNHGYDEGFHNGSFMGKVTGYCQGMNDKKKLK